MIDIRSVDQTLRAIHWTHRCASSGVVKSHKPKSIMPARESSNRVPARQVGAALPVVLCAFMASSFAFADGYSPEAATKRMKLADGLEVKLYAAEPDVRQPVSMTFDERGRLWVIQYLQYPNPAGLKPVEVDRYLRTKYDRVPEPPPKGPKGADRITIYEDTDGDGRADRNQDFIGGLNLASGLALGHGGVYVVQAPYLLYYPDKNRDDVPDGDPEVLVSGFGLEDAHAVANSLTWGPDGWLYGLQGSTVTANIDGEEFQQGVWRFHPVTKKFELFCEGGGNVWGLDFDRHGNLLYCSNGAYLFFHAVQGGYYVKGFAKHGPLHNPYTFGYFGPVEHKGYRGGHVTIGGLIYRGGDGLPALFHEKYIGANVLAHTIYWYTVGTRGSTLKAEYSGQLADGDDPWFRPVDMTTGPDGALYVADWYDERANHVDPRDDWHKSSGRIYRISAQGVPAKVGFDLNKKSSAELASLLEDKNDWRRRGARLILAERRDPKIAQSLRATLLSRPDDPAHLEQLWAMYVSGGFDDELALHLLGHADPDIRRWTVRWLGDERKVSPEIANRLIELSQAEPAAAVRSQLASTAKRLPAAIGLAMVAGLVRHDEDIADPYIPLLLWWAVEDKADSDRALVLGMLGDKQLWQLPMVRQHLIERIVRRYVSTNRETDFETCAQLLALAPSDGDVDVLLRGIEAGLEGRRLEIVPPPLRAVVARLSKERSGDLSFLRLALRLGSPDAPARALAVVADTKQKTSDRVALIQLIGQVGGDEAAPVLLKLIEPAAGAAIQLAALTALERFNDEHIPARILELYPAANGEWRDRARTLLLRRKPSTLAFLKLVDSGKVDPKSVPVTQLQQVSVFEDAEIDKLIVKHWGSLKAMTKGETLARIHGFNVSLNLAKGNAIKGKELFTKHCGTCHTLFGEGGKVGPELTGADRKNRVFLLENIVDPSNVIRKEFYSYIVVANDGRILTGLLAESTPTTVTVLDAKNQTTTLDRKDIEEIKLSPVSLMPDKLLDELDAQQVRDLMAYLQADGPVAASGPSAKK